MCKEVLEDCSHAFSMRAVDTNVRKKVKIIQHAYPLNFHALFISCLLLWNESSYSIKWDHEIQTIILKKKNSTLKVKYLKRVMNTYTLVSCWPELLDSLFLSLDYSRILRNRDCMSKTSKFSKITVRNIQNLTFNLFLRESHFYIEYVIQKFLFDEILWLLWTK